MKRRNSTGANTHKIDLEACLPLKESATGNRHVFDGNIIAAHIEHVQVQLFIKMRENTGPVRRVLENGRWTSGCTKERPRGWEKMSGVMEVEAV